jgi:hypothetical protein
MRHPGSEKLEIIRLVERSHQADTRHPAFKILSMIRSLSDRRAWRPWNRRSARTTSLALPSGEGCAHSAGRWDHRSHFSSTGPGRTTLSVCQDLIYDRHTFVTLAGEMNRSTVLGAS